MRILSLLGLTITLVILGSTSFAIATTGGLVDSYEKITMGTTGTDDSSTIGFEGDDLFGYKITNMGDIDGNGAEDFATITFHDNNYFGNAYLVLMNSDSTVKESHELSNCSNIAGQQETRTFGESLEYLGMIDGKHVLLISDYWFGAIYALSIDANNNYNHTCSLLEDANGYGADASNYPFHSTVNGNYDLGWSMTVVGDVAVDGDISTIPDLIVSIGGNDRDDADDPNAVYPPNILTNDLYRLDLSVNSTNHLKVTNMTINDNALGPLWGDRLFENAIVANIDGSSFTTNLVLGEPRGDWTGINGYVHVTTIIDSTNSFFKVKTIEFANLELAIPGQDGTPNFGIGLANIGDLDNNGVDDIAVGIEFLDIGGTNTGAVAIMFLDNQGNALKISLIANGDSEPYVIKSGDYFGKGLDVLDLDTSSNGLPVLVASAHQDDTGAGNAGAVYVMTFDEVNLLSGLSYDMTPTPVVFNPTVNNFYPQFSSFVNYAYAVESPSFGLIELPFTSTITQIDDATSIQNINFDPSSIVEEPTYCGGNTITELISGGNYTVFDNRDGSLGSKIKGTNGDDLMIASDNGDTLIGKKGNDCMIGGSGDDILKGRMGNDEMYGNDGNDLIRGNQGDDVIYGNSGNDELHGGKGSDIINGGLGDDTLRGKKGSDTLNGGLGNDNLFGGKDNDFLYGNEGDDSLNGRKGIDTCDGGIGNNTIKNCEL